jgi:hypothetical protein
MQKRRYRKGEEEGEDREGEAGGEARRKEGSASQLILSSFLSSPHVRWMV